MTKFPQDCVQGAFHYNEWWEPSTDLKKGSLIRIICPFFDKEAWRVKPMGRQDPTDHRGAKLRLERYGIGAPPLDEDLPVAALTVRKGESLGVWVAKERPALVLSVNSCKRETDALRASTLLVAPYYGVKSGHRVGFPPDFIKSVKQADFRQFIWDLLPVGNELGGALLRLDRMVTIPMKSQRTYKHMGYNLTEDALEIITDWLQWFVNGAPLSEDSELFGLAELLNPALASDQET